MHLNFYSLATVFRSWLIFLYTRSIIWHTLISILLSIISENAIQHADTVLLYLKKNLPILHYIHKTFYSQHLWYFSLAAWGVAYDCSI